jgi:cytoskeletal protein RodZ
MGASGVSHPSAGATAETGILGVKTWRQRKSISLDSIAASTKLSVRQLDAIENGDFKRLPGGIYNTNYIRQYARAIGFDEADLLAYYNGVCNPPAACVPATASPWSSVLHFPRTS